MAAVEEPSAKRQKVEEEPEKAAEDVSNGKEEVSKNWWLCILCWF